MEFIVKSTFVSLCLIASSLCGQASLAQNHTFTVKDSIEMTRFADLSGEIQDSNVLISPNQRNFIVVTSRGILSSNQTESSLWIFDTQAVQSYVLHHETTPIPRPRLLARIAVVPEIASGNAYAPVISSLQWSSDSRTLFFLGQDSWAEHRLFSVDILKSRLRALTPKGYDVLRFALAADLILCKGTRSEFRGEFSSEYNDQKPRVATGQRLVETLFPRTEDAPKVPELWLIRNGAIHAITQPDTETAQPGLAVENAWDAVLSISPDRKQIVWLCPVRSIPDNWGEYQPARRSEHFRIDPHDQSRISASSLNRIQQYVITDVETGNTSQLIHAPVGRYLGYTTPVFSRWSHDGKRLLVTNTFLPADGSDIKTRPHETSPCAAAVIDLRPRQTHCLEVVSPDGSHISSLPGSKLQNAFFGDSSDEITLEFGSSDHTSRMERYLYKEGIWKHTSCLSSTAEKVSSDLSNHGAWQQLQISVWQSLNEPPTLWVKDRATGHAAELWNPNPQFASMKLGKTTVFKWKDKNGYEWTGGLVWPVDYVAGKRYPLVLQIYQFREKEFMTDGTEPTAMAARSFASAGIFYLQGTKKPMHSFDQKEADEHLEGHLSAIDRLASLGLIDPTKVGVIGYSWTGWYVEHALIKVPERFAAATIADGNDNSYMQYRIIGLGNPPFEEQYERFNGGKPVGPGLLHWVENAPSFHLDQVKTPLRIEAIRPTGLLAEWELYSSLWQQGKPVDLIYFPDGQHILQRPLDRFTSQQGNVDWFRFWLEGYEDPDPSKREQYRRWEQMKTATQSMFSGVGPAGSCNSESLE